MAFFANNVKRKPRKVTQGVRENYNPVNYDFPYTHGSKKSTKFVLDFTL